MVNGVWCDGSATTSNTTNIYVTGAATDGGNDTLVIDLSGGDFEPSNDTPDDFDERPERDRGQERHRVHRR